MRVLHVPFTFHPDPCGGTEIYVAALCEELSKIGVTAMVAAPGERTESYLWQGIAVWRFAGAPVRDVGELYGEGDAVAAEAFDQVLAESQPEVVHFHARTRAASLRCLRQAKARGIKVIYTYHTPTATCQRGTMMRHGTTVCDGEMRVQRCATCVLATRLPSYLASALGSLPPRLGQAITGHGRLQTALRMSALSSQFQQHTRQFLAEADHVVAVCDWVRQVILTNGVPTAKVTSCRQGLPSPMTAAPLPQLSDGPLRLAYLGRLDATKGVDVLLQAIRQRPELHVTLDVFGIAQGDAGAQYLRGLRQIAARDPRVQFKPPVTPADVVSTLRGYDLLAVPSQWLETGPLVVLEAFAAGIPVIGSRLGGIAELVTHGVNGLLVEAADIEAWGEALANLAADPQLKSALQHGVPPARGTATVAQEMSHLYAQVTAQHQA